LYSDANPKDTIRIKYGTKSEVKQTINKLESIYKKGTKPHNRISQIANVMTQRTKVIKDKNPSIDKGRHKLSKDYYEFLKKRTKIKGDKDRKKLTFKT
jgi:hypothetical protein